MMYQELYLVDAHMHLGNDSKELLSFLEHSDYHGVASASSPKECSQVLKCREKTKKLSFTFGLHPWQADKYNLDEIIPWLEKANVIGEIGLDNVWCNVDMERQRKAFSKQLDLAQEWKKPVVLHTKGCEKEIAAEIQRLDVPVLVHWYSCGEYLNEYLNRDCFFTIGPDVRTNPKVQAVAKAVPENRIMVETDGLGALEWVFGRPFSWGEVLDILEENISFIAELRGISETVLKERLVKNAIDFFEIG